MSIRHCSRMCPEYQSSGVSVDKRLTSRPRDSGARIQKCTFIRKDRVEAMGLEPTNLLTASQALYQLSYAPSGGGQR